MGADAPGILKDEHRLNKRKNTGRRSVADDAESRNAPKDGDDEPTCPRLLGRDGSSLRRFGRFDITLDIGSYGGNYAGLIRISSTDNTEELRPQRIKLTVL